MNWFPDGMPVLKGEGLVEQTHWHLPKKDFLDNNIYFIQTIQQVEMNPSSYTQTLGREVKAACMKETSWAHTAIISQSHQLWGRSGSRRIGVWSLEMERHKFSNHVQ